jgi:hypothetical protein
MEQEVAAGGAGFVLLIQLAVMILMIAAVWKVFTKAGEPGWAAIVPIYNIIVMLKIAGKPLWWVLLFLVPIVNLVIAIIAMAALAARFGKGAGYVVGLILLPFIFWPMLGFGSAEYSPSAA